ncbi:hypothetical protein [Duganella levis]|uniref:Uncharacterized protein n=1 Tax=Duganella levis TaxID=2692169 RepID=A0ABW9W142_9BURK|nr:hypothetical protein [Duganella levis]MYN27595.1 hypothetical protein [Duganella levis]
MAFFEKDKGGVAVWLPIMTGPIFSLVVFVLTYWLDPLSLKQTSGIPAFFLSVIVLMIAQWWVTVIEVRKTAAYSDRLYDAIKDYLHVTPVGSPEQALRYISSRLPILREVKNTSFNTNESLERSDEKFYATKVYDDLLAAIAQQTRKELIWKDIGDLHALTRFRQICRHIGTANPRSSGKYKYKIIGHNDPQLNFILLEHVDGIKEVLFNWDFRGLGQDPTVLISRDSHIIEMFTKQFNLLWQSGTEDHDRMATRSVPEK